MAEAAFDRLLYVSDSQNDFVDVYDLKTKGMVGQIAANHPTGLATDKSENLYVTNLLGGNTTVYPFGQTQPSLTLSDPGGQPDAVAVGTDGTVYVADENGKVYVYPSGVTQPTSTLSNGAIQAADTVTLDSANDVYVAGFSSSDRAVVVKYPKASEPGVNLGKLGVDGPAGIALDRTRRIVLADFELPGVDVFKHDGISPYRMFARTSSPNRFTFNRLKSRVYVPMTSGDVNIYDYKSGNLISTLVGPSGSVMIGTAVIPAPKN